MGKQFFTTSTEVMFKGDISGVVFEDEYSFNQVVACLESFQCYYGEQIKQISPAFIQELRDLVSLEKELVANSEYNSFQDMFSSALDYYDIVHGFCLPDGDFFSMDLKFKLIRFNKKFSQGDFDFVGTKTYSKDTTVEEILQDLGIYLDSLFYLSDDIEETLLDSEPHLGRDYVRGYARAQIDHLMKSTLEQFEQDNNFEYLSLPLYREGANYILKGV